MSRVRLTLQQVHALAYDCLRHNGCDEANASAAARCISDAERDGCHSHGLFRLPWYASALVSGRVNGKARPGLTRLAPSVLRIDGDNGFAPLAQQLGHGPLLECARDNGIAVLAVINMFHVAAMWPEVERLAMDGVCALAVTASYPYVAPAGGTRPLYGTNPMGFAWPRADGPPLVFDQASSAMARGEIEIAAREGHTIASNVGLGPDGEPSTDPAVVLQGAQLGFGGYKGASLALMVELLAGPLIGEFLSFEACADDAGHGAPPKGGELIIALDPARFGDPQGNLAHAERLFEALLAQPGTRLPGARRLANRSRTPREGVEIPLSLHREILAYL
ncbi:MAG: Ldh family oxidoreductase [Gammaproteobacteria bacterium]|nr:Ldh family oxidoreductase [Gammaproteobacteria bacterium]